MNETLLIIDCQPGFISRDNKDPFKQHYPAIIKSISTQCRLAMGRQDHIVFVEFNPQTHRSTLPELIALTRDYPHKAFLTKMVMDGSLDVADYLRQKDIPRSIIRVCGVRTSQCVYFTLQGLLKMLPRTQFKVVRSGVGESISSAEYNHRSVQKLIDLNPKRVVGIGPHIW